VVGIRGKHSQVSQRTGAYNYSAGEAMTGGIACDIDGSWFDCLQHLLYLPQCGQDLIVPHDGDPHGSTEVGVEAERLIQ